MSTLTIQLEDETKTLLQAEASKANLSPGEFVRLAIMRALARVGQSPELEARAARATGHGWDEIKRHIPIGPPVDGDAVAE